MLTDRLPRLYVSTNAFEKLMGFYDREGTLEEFQNEIQRVYRIEEIISSLNQVSLMILQEVAFVNLNTRIEKLTEWIRFMKSLGLFDIDAYHITLSFSL